MKNSRNKISSSAKSSKGHNETRKMPRSISDVDANHSSTNSRVENKKKKSCYSFGSIFKSIILALIIVVLFRLFLYEPYKVPSGSMQPNLISGDRVMVSKFSYGYGKYFWHAVFLPIDLNFLSEDGKHDRIFSSEPERGDVIVFKSERPGDNNYYVKRLIGLPGDEIYLTRGTVYINDKPLKRLELEEKYAGCSSITLEKAFECKEYREFSSEDKSYVTLYADKNFGLFFPDSTSKIKIPEGYYFFLGDNRDFSQDSRYYSKMGLVPYENLIGKVEFVFWNSEMSIMDNIGKMMHHSHFFNKLYDDVDVKEQQIDKEDNDKDQQKTQ